MLVTDAGWPDGGRFEGSEAVSRFARDFEQVWASLRFRVDNLEEIDDAVLANARWQVKGTTSGVETDLEFSAVFRFDRAGDLTELHLFFDHDEARAFAETRGP